MRILTLCYEFPPVGGGGSKVVYGLSKELSRLGHKIDVVTMGFGELPPHERIENLDIYFEDCVIGGPGAFVIPIRDRSQFKDATRTKLVLEIAGRTPQAQVVPVQARQPRISCSIGEQMWRERWGN